MQTRKRILESSRKLFNQQSYDTVTIRMIAQELEMSSGNLNYHFKKKEDILSALYFEMVAEFDQRLKNLPETSFSIVQIRDDIYQSMKRMLHYRFFWTDLYNLLKVHEGMREHFQKVYLQRLAGSQYMFNQLTNQKIMLSPATEKEYEFLAERMICFGNTWLYSSNLYQSKTDEQMLETQCRILLSALYPYLTEKGKLAFNNIYPEKSKI